MSQWQGTLGFLGYGNMGSAIAGGLIGRGLVPADRVHAYDPEPARQAAAKSLGMVAADTPAGLAGAVDTLVFSVKPQVWKDAAAMVAPVLRPGARIVSIMAGVSIASLRAALPEGVRVIRVMPNTPALVGAGAAGIALDENCGPEDEAAARMMFEAVGVAEVVPESAINAITALSGSGPAYFFYLVECLVKAAVKEGLDEAVATRLAVQTAFGAGKLLAESGESASTLREKVTSKGGTTFAALESFRADNLESVVVAAVHAASERARELGS